MGRRRSGAGIGALAALVPLLVAGMASSGCAGDGAIARHSVIHVYTLDAEGKIVRRGDGKHRGNGNGDRDGNGAMDAAIATGPCAHTSGPVDGPVSSPFGKRDGKMHDGIDLAVG
jgi:murein DD-endopeptidase MepM/ murein hydrolase activator NlpD